VGAIETGDDKQQKCQEEAAMVARTNAGIDPAHSLKIPT